MLTNATSADTLQTKSRAITIQHIAVLDGVPGGRIREAGTLADIQGERRSNSDTSASGIVYNGFLGYIVGITQLHVHLR